MSGTRGTRAIGRPRRRFAGMALALSVLVASVVALAQEPSAPDREDELGRLQTRYRELQERYLALAEREAEREARTAEMREAVEKLRAAVDDLVARQAELVGSLTALRDRAARIDEAWLRELAVCDVFQRDPHALPWEAPDGEAFHVIACRIEEFAREGDTATVVVHEVVRIGERIVQRRRTLTFEHRDPIWQRRQAASRSLRVDPAPPWIRIDVRRANDGDWSARVDGEFLELTRLLEVVRDRARAWSELGIPRADIPAWIVAPHSAPHVFVSGVLAVLSDAGVDSVDFVGVPDGTGPGLPR